MNREICKISDRKIVELRGIEFELFFLYSFDDEEFKSYKRIVRRINKIGGLLKDFQKFKSSEGYCFPHDIIGEQEDKSFTEEELIVILRIGFHLSFYSEYEEWEKTNDRNWLYEVLKCEEIVEKCSPYKILEYKILRKAFECVKSKTDEESLYQYERRSKPIVEKKVSLKFNYDELSLEEQRELDVREKNKFHPVLLHNIKFIDDNKKEIINEVGIKGTISDCLYCNDGKEVGIEVIELYVDIIRSIVKNDKKALYERQKKEIEREELIEKRICVILMVISLSLAFGVILLLGGFNGQKRFYSIWATAALFLVFLYIGQKIIRLFYEK